MHLGDLLERLPKVRADRLHQSGAALAGDALSGHQPTRRSSANKSRTPTTSICRGMAIRSFPTRSAPRALVAKMLNAAARCRWPRPTRWRWPRFRPRPCASTSKTAAAVSGAARRVADLLKHAGFTIGEVGNADRSDYCDDRDPRTFERRRTPVRGCATRSRRCVHEARRRARYFADAERRRPTEPAATGSDVTVIVGSDLATSPATVLAGSFVA